MARNILVVEDDNNISDLIRMYLEKEGFEVRIAADGGKAVEEFKAREPDLVLLDVMLPVLDGWGVCAKIRETSKCPIIMLTAKGEVNDRIHGLEMGADDYLVKPFEMKELIARIKAVIRRFQAAGMTPEEIAQVDLATEAPDSLQRETADGLALEGLLGTEAPEEGLVERIALREAVDQLPEKERMTILLRYFKGLTQERAARVLGVSQVQVSRLERRGLERLRQSFAE